MKKKTILSLGMAAIFALSMGIGLANAASSSVTASNITPITYATEIMGNSYNTKTLTNGKAYILTIGGAINQNNRAEITFTLDSGTWGTALNSGNCVATIAGGGGYVNKKTGGAASEKSVVYEIWLDAAAAAAGDTIVFTVPTIIDGSGILGTEGKTINVTAEIVPTGTVGTTFPDVVSGTPKQPIATSAKAFALTITPNADLLDATPRNTFIDVGSSGMKFIKDGTTLTSVSLGKIALANSGNAPVIEDGATTLNLAALTAGRGTLDITLGGDFSALSSIIYDKSGNGPTDETNPAFDLTGSGAILSTDVANFVSGQNIYAVAGGTKVINPQTITIAEKLTLPWQTWYASDSTSDSQAKLVLNGAYSDLNFVFQPTAPWSSYIRVVNTSSGSANIYFLMYNDAGVVAFFPMSSVNVKGAALSASLAANAATAYAIPVKSLTDAAAAANASFTVGTTEKLRVRVISSGASVSAAEYLLSSDGTTMTTIQGK